MVLYMKHVPRLNSNEGNDHIITNISLFSFTIGSAFFSFVRKEKERNPSVRFLNIRLQLLALQVLPALVTQYGKMKNESGTLISTKRHSLQYLLFSSLPKSLRERKRNFSANKRK